MHSNSSGLNHLTVVGVVSHTRTFPTTFPYFPWTDSRWLRTRSNFLWNPCWRFSTSLRRHLTGILWAVCILQLHTLLAKEKNGCRDAKAGFISHAEAAGRIYVYIYIKIKKKKSKFWQLFGNEICWDNKWTKADWSEVINIERLGFDGNKVFPPSSSCSRLFFVLGLK